MSLASLFLAFFQTPSPSPTPVVLERMPAMFTLIYVGGFACVILLLLLGLIRNRRRPVSTAAIPADLPKDVRKRLGSTSTNRGLRALRWLFILLSLALFGFHVYWAKYAADRNEKFQELGYKDLRTRRLSESTLRGWILDRSGRLDQPLAYTDATRVVKFTASIHSTKRFHISLGRTAAIRDLSVHCLVYRVAQCLKRWMSCVVGLCSLKAIRMYD